jgi:hypothetical protein
MKTMAPETIRLMQPALDTRDSLRRLAASIDAAGDDPGRQAEICCRKRARWPSPMPTCSAER